MNEANSMLEDFTEPVLSEEVTGTIHFNTPKRVRRYITNQRDLSSNAWEEGHNACYLTEAYPTLDILSPELKRICALHLTHSLLETVPYLSSEYLSPEEQANLALKCATLEFSSGDSFSSHPDLGRGVLIFRHGTVVINRNVPGYVGGVPRKSARRKKSESRKQESPTTTVNANEVLVEDGYCRKYQNEFHIVGYSKVLYIPRAAIYEALETNPRAWKECARWRYFAGALILKSHEVKSETGSVKVGSTIV